MAELETRTYSIEQLREFSTRVFVHFGVPRAGRRAGSGCPRCG